jgi:hypothetical protein
MCTNSPNPYRSSTPCSIPFLPYLNPTNPTLFLPHLRPLSSCSYQRLYSPAPTQVAPTVAKPFPTSGGSFTFPPPAQGSKLASEDDAEEDGMALDEEKEDTSKAALEFRRSRLPLGRWTDGPLRSSEGVWKGCASLGMIPSMCGRRWMSV